MLDLIIALIIIAFVVMMIGSGISRDHDRPIGRYGRDV